MFFAAPEPEDKPCWTPLAMPNNTQELLTYFTKLKLSNIQCSTKHITGHIGDGFLQVNSPNNSVKTLKEDSS